MDEDAYRRGLNQGAHTGGDWDSYRQGVNTREWNERVRPATGSDSGGSWNVGGASSGGASAAGGAGDGSGRLLLILGGLIFAVPALVMGVLAAPVLKPAATALGRYRPFRWGQTLRAAVVGNMWYLGLTVVAFLGLETYVMYGLHWDVLNGDHFRMMAVWQQWPATAWWSGLKLIEWSQLPGGPAALAEIYGQAQIPPSPASLAMVAAAVATLHLPGLLAYAIVLWRAGAVQDTFGGLALALGLAAVLVILTLPPTAWLARAIYTALT